MPNLLTLAVFLDLVLMHVGVVSADERELQKEFGNEFTRYGERVPGCVLLLFKEGLPQNKVPEWNEIR